MPIQKLRPEDDRIIFEGTGDPNTRPEQIARFMVEFDCSKTTINNGIRRHKKRLRKEKMAVASKAHRQRKTRQAVGVGAADEAHDNDGNEENQGVPPVADGIAGPPVPQAVEGFKPASPALPPPPKPQPTLKPLSFEANTGNTSLPAGNLQRRFLPNYLEMNP